MSELTKESAHRIASETTIRKQAFINGRFTAATSGETFETVNPATSDVIAAVAHCDIDDVDRSGP